MRSFILAGVFCSAAAASAQTPAPVSCKALAAQATQALLTAMLETGPEKPTADEKRVFAEFKQGLAEECVKADGENCYTRVGEETAKPTLCPKDPLKAWMAESARQIMPTQTKQNRATQALNRILGKPDPVAAAPVVAAPVVAAPVVAAPVVAAPVVAAPVVAAPVVAAPVVAAPVVAAPAPPVASAGAQPSTPPSPPPPPALDDRPLAGGRVEEEVLEGDALLNRPLTNLTRRQLGATVTLLEEQKPGFGLVFGMYGGGAGALAGGSFFLVTSLGYYGSTFGIILGVAALTAGVAMVVIGSLALVSRMRKRSAYTARIEEIRTLMHKRSSSVELIPLPTMMTVAQW